MMEDTTPVNQGKPTQEFVTSRLDKLIKQTVNKFNDPDLKEKGMTLILDLVWRIVQNPEKLENMLARTIWDDINVRDIGRYTMELFPEKKTPEEIQAQSHASSKGLEIFTSEEWQQILAAGCVAAKLMFSQEDEKINMFSLQSIPTFLSKNVDSDAETDVAATIADSVLKQAKSSSGKPEKKKCKISANETLDSSSIPVAEQNEGENFKLKDPDPEHFIDQNMPTNPQELDVKPKVTAPKEFPECSSSIEELPGIDLDKLCKIKKLKNRSEISKILGKFSKSVKKT